MKKSKTLFIIFVILLICSLSLVLVACGGNNGDNNNNDNSNGNTENDNGNIDTTSIFRFKDNKTGYILSNVIVGDNADSLNTELVIPATYNDKPVIAIGNNAFSKCNLFTSITIPNSITSIGNSAFYN